MLLDSNSVDFDDLLVHTARLLLDNPDLRRQLDATIVGSWVDEYQDTMPFSIVFFGVFHSTTNTSPLLVILIKRSMDGAGQAFEIYLNSSGTIQTLVSSPWNRTIEVLPTFLVPLIELLQTTAAENKSNSKPMQLQESPFGFFLIVRVMMKPNVSQLRLPTLSTPGHVSPMISVFFFGQMHFHVPSKLRYETAMFHINSFVASSSSKDGKYEML